MENKKLKRIGIVVAMEKEITPFLNGIGKSVSKKSVCGYDFIEYKIKNKKVFVVQSGIGEIYATGATALLIGNFKCELILNYGVCGSLGFGFDILDTMLISGVVHYDFDLSPIDNVKVGQYPNSEIILKTDENYLEFVKSVCPNIRTGICASADKFVADEDIKTKLHEEFGADVCDMEIAGIVLTCKNANVPVISLKAVSDGKGGAEDYQKRVTSATKVCVEIFTNILNSL